MADLDSILADLEAESASLDALVGDLTDGEWQTPTPAAGWTITHQIAHLAWTDSASALAATDADGFAAELKKAMANPLGFVDEGAEQTAKAAPAELLASWRRGRAALADALHNYPAGQKVPWFGPPMSAATMATARIMETWAHGQDVADALGVTRTPTARLRHVAHIGIRARNFAYSVREQTPPAEEFRIELVGPHGESWTWGPDDAAQRVVGPALDFALLVTRRRHRDDLKLNATGTDAAHWLTIAQAFAGAPGTGREAGQFA